MGEGLGGADAAQALSFYTRSIYQSAFRLGHVLPPSASSRRCAVDKMLLHVRLARRRASPPSNPPPSKGRAPRSQRSQSARRLVQWIPAVIDDVIDLRQLREKVVP